MKRYIVKPGRHVTIGGMTHGPGFVFDAPETDAVEAIADGAIAPVAGSKSPGRRAPATGRKSSAASNPAGSPARA